MAFDFIFESNFEQADNSEWDSSSGTIDFPNYKQLADSNWSTSQPYSGGACMRVQLRGGTTDATLIEGDIDIADTVTRHFNFDVMFSPDFTGTANDTFHLFELQGAANLATTAIGARIVSATNVINFGIVQDDEAVVDANMTFAAAEVERGVWYTLSSTVLINAAATGTNDLFITREGDDSQTTADIALTSQDGIAVLRGVLGVQDNDATTTGDILFDNFVFDDGRLHAAKERFPISKLLTKTGHAFVGPGKIDRVSLLSGAATNCVLSIFDTDVAYTNDPSNIVAELKNLTNNEVVTRDRPIEVQRGCYIVLSGTTPRAVVDVGLTSHYSVASQRRLGAMGGP